jgi:hypothetical protein
VKGEAIVRQRRQLLARTVADRDDDDVAASLDLADRSRASAGEVEADSCGGPHRERVDVGRGVGAGAFGANLAGAVPEGGRDR